MLRYMTLDPCSDRFRSVRSLFQRGVLLLTALLRSLGNTGLITEPLNILAHTHANLHPVTKFGARQRWWRRGNWGFTWY